jgi:hypothetical protein
MSTAPATATVSLSSGSVEVGGIEWGGTAPVRPKLTVAGTLQVDTLADGTGSSAIYNLVDTGTVVAEGSMSTTSLTLEGELDGPATVTVGSSGTLSLGGGSAAPELAAGADLVNSGTGTQASSNGALDMSGASVFENAGSLTLADGQGIADTDSAHPSKFVNDAAGTVSDDASASSGVSIGPAVTNNGSMSLTAGSLGSVSNGGTLAVTGSGGTLTAGGLSATNTDSGTFDVQRGATLFLAGTWDMSVGATTDPSSTGTLEVSGTLTTEGSNTLPATTIDERARLVAKGSLSAGTTLDEGTLTVATSVSVQAAGSLGPGQVALTVSGGVVKGPGKLTAGSIRIYEGCELDGVHLVNTGIGYIESGLRLADGAELENAGTRTLHVGHQIVDETTDDPSKVVNDSSATLAAGTSLGAPATIFAHFVNDGTILVARGNGLTISGEGDNTDSGQLTVNNGGSLMLDGSWSIPEGKAVSNTSSGSLAIDQLTAPGDNTLGGFSVGTLIPQGSVTADGTTMDELEGPGTVTVPSGDQASVDGFSGADLVNDGTLTAGGNLSGGSRVDNAGVMKVSGALLDQDSGDPSTIINESSGRVTGGAGASLDATVTDDGLFAATNGSFSITGDKVTVGTGATLEADTGASLILAGAWQLPAGVSTTSSSPGTLRVPGTLTAAGSNSLRGMDVTGKLVAQGAVTAPSLVLEGELDGPGTVTVPKGGSLKLGGANLAVMKAGADLVNDGSASQDGSEGTLNMYGASVFENAGSLALADGQGIYDLDSANPSRVVNDGSGTLSFAGGSGSASVSVTPKLTDGGLLDVTGGMLSVPGLTNLSGGKLTGGTYHVLGGTLAFPSDVADNAATLELGTSGSFSGSGADALSGLAVNSGVLTLEQSLAVSGALSNSGTVNLGAGVLSVSSYSQSAGSTAVGGQATLRAGSGSGSVVVGGGRLFGTGTVAGGVSGAGTVQPAGPLAGPLRVTGSYDGSVGMLSIPVSGTSSPGTDFGQLVVSGSAKLGGTLAIATKSGYLPPVGTVYTVLKAAGVTGKFSKVDGASLSDRHYVVSYTAKSVVLTVAGAPSVSGVAPRAGSTAGGNTVTITGTNLLAGATASFGTVAASSVKVVSSTEITATAPAHAAGTVNVTVATADGKSATGAADDYAYGAPVVSGVSPDGGPVGGGTKITVTGRGFVAGMTVSAGGSAASAVTVVSGTQLTAQVPAHAAGTVNVVVHTAAGTSAMSSQSLFAYGAPVVTSLSPGSGPTAGGKVVTINGSGFVTGAKVRFGSSASAKVTFVNARELRANSPAHTAGVVGVVVSTPGGTSANTTADHYTYAPS